MNEKDVKANVILIRELMSKIDLTIKDLAEKLDITRETLSSCLNKRSKMTLERLQKIADHLGVPYESLLPSTDQLLLRRFEQILVQFSLNQNPVEVSLPEIFDLAVKLGYAREVSPWDVHLSKSDAQSSVEEAIKDL